MSLFGALRVRRCALSLIFAYLFALNLLAATILQAREAAAAPLMAAMQSATCSDGRGALDPSDEQNLPDRRSSCPSCVTLCPMGGCAPLGASVLAHVRLPLLAGAISRHALPLADDPDGAAIYPSDLSAQAPPFAAGRHTWRIAEAA